MHLDWMRTFAECHNHIFVVAIVSHNHTQTWILPAQLYHPSPIDSLHIMTEECTICLVEIAANDSLGVRRYPDDSHLPSIFMVECSIPTRAAVLAAPI